MKRSLRKTREEARRLYLTNEMSTNAEIAVHLQVKPHTVGRWRREEDWDGFRLKIDRRAAEMFVEQLATDRTNLNSSHFKLWSVVVSQLLEVFKTDGSDDTIKRLERMAAIIDKAQKGQRLARGLSLDGETEEKIRAEGEAETRRLIDLFVEVVKEQVDDPDLRDTIARAILVRAPNDDGDRDGDAP
jgi:uncharacterized membrane-anchored protein YjiN (DUF445 family)